MEETLHATYPLQRNLLDLIFRFEHPKALMFSPREVIMPEDDPFHGEIDQFDRKILDVLVENGRMSITELSSRIGLSKTPCQTRLRRLLAEGYIDGFRAVLNPSKLGLDHVAFAEVKLTDTHDSALQSFNE